MLQTLFYIPESWLGLPVFGLGWALIVWAIGTVALLLYLVRKQGWSADTLGYLPLLAVLGFAVYYLVPGLVESGRGLPIRGFGVMMLLGVVGGVGLSIYRARQMGVDSEVIFSLAFHMFLLGILGARLFFIIEYPEKFFFADISQTVQALLNVAQGGIVLYGAFFGGMIAAIWFFARRRLPALALSDIIAPGMLVGAALGRVGCFLNGCCFGGLCETDLPQVQFPEDSPPYVHQLQLGWLHGMKLRAEEGRLHVTEVLPDSPAAQATQGSQDAPAPLRPGDELATINGKTIGSFADAAQAFSIAVGPTYLRLGDGSVRAMRFVRPARSLPVHPAQLYDAINLALMALVLWLYYPLRRHDGEVLALLLALYPITRFTLEIIRVDEPGQFGTGFSISQIISIGVLAAAVMLTAWIEYRHRPLALPWQVAQ